VRRVRINIHDIGTNMVIEKQDKENIFVIDNIFSKRKLKRCKMNVNIYKDSEGI